mgnify:FL=1
MIPVKRMSISNPSVMYEILTNNGADLDVELTDKRISEEGVLSSPRLFKESFNREMRKKGKTNSS